MDDKAVDFFCSAIDAYLVELGNRGEPTRPYLSFDFIHTREWHIFGAEMVGDELRELTNSVNRWHGNLERWHAWNNVIQSNEEEEAWKVRREFVETLVHYCLLEPSAIVISSHL